MKITFVLSANAGCSVTMGGVRFWIDALHCEKTPLYQSVTPELFSAMTVHPYFMDPDLMIFTHAHGDHYSREMTEAAHLLFPQAAVIRPFEESLSPLSFDCKGVRFRFFRLPHEGKEYASVPLFGFTASCEGHTLLVPGDCAVGSAALQKALVSQRSDDLPSHAVLSFPDSPVDCALVDFPWASLRRGQNLLRELGVKHLLVYHLPPAEEDGGRYIYLTERAAQKLDGMDVHILKQSLQMEEIIIDT